MKTQLSNPKYGKRRSLKIAPLLASQGVLNDLAYGKKRYRMEKNYYPATFDYRSVYRNIHLFRRFEGGSVYTAEGSNCWVVITSEGTMIDMLSDEDRKDLEERAICVYTFPTRSERDEFAASRYPAHGE